MSSRATNDHIVPRMYLKRFAEETSGGPRIAAADVSTPDRSFITSTRNIAAQKRFYWGTGPTGVPTHDMEVLLTAVEDVAAGAFRRVLDKGRTHTDDALPDKWPADRPTRSALAWWLAAQLVRTAPQRDRLWELHGNDLDPPDGLGPANVHHAYMIQAIAPLAAILHARPWGIGFTNMCLLTSDSPVQVLNAHPQDDPVETAAYWDIYVPLDPHRFWYLPGRMHTERRDLMRDHRINLPGGLALALNMSVVESAHNHLIWHPRHDPLQHLNLEDASAIRRSRLSGMASGNVINYETVPPNFGIERRWLDVHTWDSPTRPGVGSGNDARGNEPGDDEITAIAEEMISRLGRAQTEWERRRSQAPD